MRKYTILPLAAIFLAACNEMPTQPTLELDSASYGLTEEEKLEQELAEAEEEAAEDEAEAAEDETEGTEDETEGTEDEAIEVEAPHAENEVETNG